MGHTDKKVTEKYYCREPKVVKPNFDPRKKDKQNTQGLGEDGWLFFPDYRLIYIANISVTGKRHSKI